jgi:hypothetical protein
MIHPSLSTAFENRALALLSAKEYETFMSQAEALIHQFPKIEGWLSGWLQESHAKMLFTPFCAMSKDAWNSILDTTNAEEAMHWKLYAAVGKNHALLEGLKGLWRFAEHYQLLAAGQLSMFETLTT